MKLLQFTDIHLTTPGKTIGGRDPNANFEKALRHALTHHRDAEALIITGDLSDWGETADYERLKTQIDALPFPVGLCIGNHDGRPTLAKVFPDRLNDEGFFQQVMPLSLGQAVLLDTWGPETHAGHFCEARAAWLDRTLATLEGPVQIFLHHNPIPSQIGPMDQIMLLDHERLGAVVRRHSEKIAHMHFGHCHLPPMGTFHGAPVSGIRGTKHAGWPAFDEPTMLCASELPESYGVIDVTANTTSKLMVEFGYDSNVRVEGSPDYSSWTKSTQR